MKIALVTETYPPEVNGVAMTLHRLVAGILSVGHTMQLVRPQQAPQVEPTDLEWQLEELLVSSVPLPGYDGLRIGMPAMGRMKRLWKRSRPDVVHIATEGPLGAAALWVARRMRIPVVSSFHTNFHSYGAHYGVGLLQGVGFAYLRAFHNYTAATFAPTRAICEELAAQGIRHTRVMSRGVDCDLYQPSARCEALRASWLGNMTAPVVLYVGRIAQEKNMALAIRGFYEIQCKQPNACFVLVGDGPMRAELEAAHPEFIFTGFQRGADLAKCYASADVFLFPSVTETFGNVLTEAMASGLACVAYDYAAAREYATDGVHALLAAKGDEAGFIAAAGRLVNDERLIEQLGAAARELALQLSWSSVVRAYLADTSAILQEEHTAVDAPLHTLETI
ncbi:MULTISPECIES: glycosyltransferase family 1 protein [unclassified Lentimonas]|uniref:glycosyltransferase family 4 protein n=1 Tax=unclassified Lentimonas TaxID=2630993 RepID=UPI0013277303|nr:MULTISPECIES: glycosyltransferase family 1 protein [unclassified Lentimonas]CAA6678149.1 Glycosyltransferase [Lentimonas sp. CC4]CAA6685962.1 Glycosyltransferase [Lentimonas sp. CC6]CAA6691841.1 Glycosyltransferase [Lentimonas sp. CC19]CAA6694589.1 Glycosyltransferase [Lentimonas sp. CC10]CAA7072122.1 Glycosyltransferase [Lentimonas sp. CC11]